MEIRYEASHTLSYGYFLCPHCQRKIFGTKDNFIHAPICPVREEGFEKTIYCYGPKEIELVKSRYQFYGKDSFKGTIQELVLEKEVLNQ